MRPQAANKNFPYHVRTTQIGAATLNENDHVTSFRHNVYEEVASNLDKEKKNVFNLFTVNANVTNAQPDTTPPSLQV